MLMIREIQDQDVEALSELYLEARIKTFTWIEPQNYKLEDFEKDTEDEVILVAENNGVLAGFISLYISDSFVHCLFIDSAYQGQGIGHKLLDEAKKYMPLPLSLKCLSKNSNALSFYKKIGWKPVNEVTGAEDSYWNMIYDK